MKDPLCNLSGAMTIVEKVYLKWMFDDLKLSKITGFLFSDNSRMINIHKKCGWITVDVVPIKKIFTGEETSWEEITTKSNNENVERYFNNKKIGCIGNGGYDKKNNSSRLDNMMKDPLCNFPNAMTIVEKVYLKWMFDDLKLSKITGFLFSDNSKMIKLHKKCGWITTDVIPIKKISAGGETRWEEITTKPNDENVERYFNKIELTRENIMKNFDDIKYKLLV